MPKFLFAVLLISLLANETYVTTASDEEDFFKICSPSRCSKHGPEVRFPFRLETQPLSCGAPGMHVSCSGQDTIMYHPVLGSCIVTAISYSHQVINISPLVDSNSSSYCPLQRLISKNLSTDIYYKPQTSEVSLVGCSRDSIPANLYGIDGPVSCLVNKARQFWYLVDPEAYTSFLPLDCTVVSKGIPMLPSYIEREIPPVRDYFQVDDKTSSSFKSKANRVLSIGETALAWYSSNITSVCRLCEHESRHCWFSPQTDQAFC